MTTYEMHWARALKRGAALKPRRRTVVETERTADHRQRLGAPTSTETQNAFSVYTIEHRRALPTQVHDVVKRAELRAVHLRRSAGLCPISQAVKCTLNVADVAMLDDIGSGLTLSPRVGHSTTAHINIAELEFIPLLRPSTRGHHHADDKLMDEDILDQQTARSAPDSPDEIRIRKS